MPTYVSLMNWTDQGIRESKGTVDRSKQATSLAAKMGGEVKALYWTVGPYDLVAIADFPDEATGIAFQLALGSAGHLRTITMPAHTAEEMTAIIGKVG